MRARGLIVLAIVCAAVWFAALVAAAARAANPTAQIANIEKATASWKPFVTKLIRNDTSKRLYLCRYYDDAPTTTSLDSTWQVVVCRLVKPRAKA